MREDLWSTGEARRKHICLIAGRRKKRGLEGGSEDRRGVKVVRDLVRNLLHFLWDRFLTTTPCSPSVFHSYMRPLVQRLWQPSNGPSLLGTHFKPGIPPPLTLRTNGRPLLLR